MKQGLFIAFVFLRGIGFAQEVDKPVLAIGPWFSKKTETNRPVENYQPTTIELETYLPQIDSLSAEIKQIKRSSPDSLWQGVFRDFKSLTTQLSKTPHLERALISDEFMHRLVMQATRARRVDLSLYFIDEAKRIHPEGIYGTTPNCKHL